MDGKLTGGYT
jgi:small subunit ribosomal protein S14e